MNSEKLEFLSVFGALAWVAILFIAAYFFLPFIIWIYLARILGKLSQIEERMLFQQSSPPLAAPPKEKQD